MFTPQKAHLEYLKIYNQFYTMKHYSNVFGKFFVAVY